MHHLTAPICPECGATMKLCIAGSGPAAGKKFWGCSAWPACEATHGAHPDGRPLGIPGNAATKAARRAAHDAFDALWKSGLMSRSAAYGWMRLRTGLSEDEAHIGAFDIERCETLMTLVRGLHLDDPTVLDARRKLRQALEEVLGAQPKVRRDWYWWLASTLKIEGPVYLVELTVEQCVAAAERLRRKAAHRSKAAAERAP